MTAEEAIAQTGIDRAYDAFIIISYALLLVIFISTKPIWIIPYLIHRERNETNNE